MTETLHPGAAAPADDRPAPGPAEPEPTSSPLPLAILAGLLVLLGVAFTWWAVLLVLALLVSILLHELGHYLAAKRSGMQVTEFFLGMGPHVWSYRRGETRFGLKAFPVGAYVKITGMHNLEEVDPEIEDRTYRAKGYVRRLATVLAGPAMNILIAFVVLYGVVLVSGTRAEDGWTVRGVVEGSAAAQAGVQDGDRVLEVGDRPVRTFDDFAEAVDDQAGQAVSVVVARGGERLELPATLGWSLDAEAAAAIPSEPALRAGARAVSVDGVPVASYDQLRTALADLDQPAELIVEMGVTRFRLPVEAAVVLPEDGARGFFGIGHESRSVRHGPVEAVGTTAWLLQEQVRGTLGALGRLFSPSGLAGYADLVVDSTTSGSAAGQGDGPQLQPVEEGVAAPRSMPAEERPISILGIVRLGGDLGVEQGLVTVLILLASVNLVLALINLVPLLPFDGGHAAVATYEAIRGAVQGRPHRVDMNRLLPLTYAVVLLLVFIGVSSIWLDVRNPVQLP